MGLLGIDEGPDIKSKRNRLLWIKRQVASNVILIITKLKIKGRYTPL